MVAMVGDIMGCNGDSSGNNNCRGDGKNDGYDNRNNDEMIKLMIAAIAELSIIGRTKNVRVFFFFSSFSKIISPPFLSCGVSSYSPPPPPPPWTALAYVSSLSFFLRGQ